MKRDYRQENRVKLLGKWRDYCQKCRRRSRRTDKGRLTKVFEERDIDFEVTESRGGFSSVDVKRRSILSYDVTFVFDDRDRLIRVKPVFLGGWGKKKK